MIRALATNREVPWLTPCAGTLEDVNDVSKCQLRRRVACTRDKTTDLIIHAYDKKTAKKYTKKQFHEPISAHETESS